MNNTCSNIMSSVVRERVSRMPTEAQDKEEWLQKLLCYPLL